MTKNNRYKEWIDSDNGKKFLESMSMMPDDDWAFNKARLVAWKHFGDYHPHNELIQDIKASILEGIERNK